MTTIINIFKKNITKDTGLRGTSEGRLFVDKTVFYRRIEVREGIRSIRESTYIKAQIKENRS